MLMLVLRGAISSCSGSGTKGEEHAGDWVGVDVGGEGGGVLEGYLANRCHQPIGSFHLPLIRAHVPAHGRWGSSESRSWSGTPLGRTARRIALMAETFLGHFPCLRSNYLPFDLFAGPSSGFEGAKLKLAVRSSFLDQLCNPLHAEIIYIFCMRKCIGQIATRA